MCVCDRYVCVCMYHSATTTNIQKNELLDFFFSYCSISSFITRGLAHVSPLDIQRPQILFLYALTRSAQ